MAAYHHTLLDYFTTWDISISINLSSLLSAHILCFQKLFHLDEANVLSSQIKGKKMLHICMIALWFHRIIRHLYVPNLVIMVTGLWVEIYYIIRMLHESEMLYNPDGMLQMKQRNLIGPLQDTAVLKSILNRGLYSSPDG